MVSFSRSNESDNPLAKLLQASQDIAGGSPLQTTATSNNEISDDQIPQILSLAANPQFGPEPEEESCGRPFCKLKRRPHFHCNICNQGFTEKDKLEPHLKRHASPQEMPNSLAALLKEPLPQEEINHSRSSPLSLVVSTTAVTATTAAVTPINTATTTTTNSSA